jgi:hypothetical protein
VVDEVREVVAKLWARSGGLRWGDMRVRPWRARGGAARRREPREEKKGEENEENRAGSRFLLPTTCTSDAVAFSSRASRHVAVGL